MNHPAHRASVERYVTQARLGPYLAETGKDYALAEELYVWNLRVSGAFHEVLGVFEVALRNALCEQLRHRHGKRTGTWLDSGEARDHFRESRHRHGKRTGTWLDDPTSTFDARRIEQIKAARRALSQKGKPLTEGRIVAELSFGFWRFLLSKRYQNTLWAPHLRKAFPGMRPQRREMVYKHVEALLTLRNRIAHHEPIHRFPLADLHAAMLLVTSWIDPGMSNWLANLSRVPSVLAAKPKSGSGSGGRSS